MRKKAVTILLTSALICVLAVGSVYAAKAYTSTGAAVSGVCSEIHIDDQEMVIDSGTLSADTGFNTIHHLQPANGSYINLYVENHGSVVVVASIDGKGEQRLQPGEKGYVSIEASRSDYDYRFKVSPVSARADISYTLTQGDRPAV